MNVPEWVTWVAAGLAMVVWRRVVQGWMRAGRFTPQVAAAVYAAIIPVLVIAAFALWGRLGPNALVYAALGFAISYGIALMSFRRLALMDRDRG